MPYVETVRNRLVGIYEDMIWLSRREHVTPARARAWYTAVMSESMKTKVRMFTGRVSRAAVEADEGNLVLEHYNRLSRSLTEMLESHVKSGNHDANAFLCLIEDCERVNITTVDENHRVQSKKGDYQQAGIVLLDWKAIEKDKRHSLWRKKLRNQVANHHEYAPTSAD